MRSRADFALAVLLLAVTVVWGWTFVIVKEAVASYGVIAFLAMRFALATAVMAPLAVRRANARAWATGAVIGLVLAAAYVLQTYGIRYTTATNSGLITGLFVVFAPAWNRVVFGVRTDRLFMAAAAASLCGLALLTGSGPALPTGGDVLTLGCAACFGLHIALLDRHAHWHDQSALALAQLAAATVVFGAVWPFSDPLTLPTGATVWRALAVTGVAATAAAFWVQTAAQRRLPATRVAMILTMEPVAAAIFGWLLAGDRLTALQVVGAGLMVAALMAANVRGVPERCGGAGTPVPDECAS